MDTGRFCTHAATAALAVALAPHAAAQVTVRSGAAADAAGLAGVVEDFRNDLGELNAPEPGSKGAGRRQIDWDAAPDAVSAPNDFPGDFFNAGFAPRARGVVFSTPGTGFQLSATEASGVGERFANVNPAYDEIFSTFSPERLFTAVGSHVVEVEFFIPGEDTPALTRGFGAVFTDVDAGSTTIEYFNKDGASLGVFGVEAGPTEDGSVSFFGAAWATAIVAKVRITAGDTALGGLEDGGDDLVVMDDFIFGEPVIETTPTVRNAAGAAGADVQDAVDAFRADLGGDLNAPEPGSVGNGRREINWDAAPDAVSAPNDFPGDFFNAPFFPRARGAVFSTPGNGFQLSATEASGVGVRFANIDPSYEDLFSTFSPERLFTPLGSTTVDVEFFIPGEDVPAVTRGFGAVFTDVDLAGSTTIEYFDVNGASLGVFEAQATEADAGLSFLGVSFQSAIVASARITSGDAPLGGPETGGVDLVVMDDFIIGEPIVPGPPCADLDDDGFVGSTDLNLLLASFNIDGGGDLDGDGVTYSSDLNLVLAQFGSNCD